MKKLNKGKLNKNKLEIIAIVAILLILAIIVGVNRIKLSNFNPINGDFQNYNPVRRFLDGQIPYKDFAVYLGTGHLILLSFFQLILGNNFTISLFITNMVTMLCFELTVFVVSFLILKNKKKALYVTLFMAAINILRPQFVNYLNQDFINALNFGLAPGNSARLIRIVILPILVLLIYAGFKFIDNTQNQKISTHKQLAKKIYMAIIAGTAILWSNDGGIATYISISLIYFILLIKQYKTNIKEIIKYTFMYIGISAISFLLILAVITRGNVLSWFEFNFGVSSYQKWYYGAAYWKENISLVGIDVSIINTLLITMAIYYIYKTLIEKNTDDILRYAMLAFVAIASILTAYLYWFLSGGTSKDMINLVMLILIVNYAVLILDKVKKEVNIAQILKVGVIVLSVATIVTNVGTQLKNRKNRDTNAIYIESLGGYFTDLGESIEYAINRIGKEKIFSTYASAIEAATGQFQPTGTDYIIHCLGDKQREEYIGKFKQENFKYVVDVKDNKDGYRYWIRNANWFFYKELYKEYKPTFLTEYSVFYEKNDEKEKNNNEEIGQIEKIKQDDGTYIIKVKTNDKTYNGIADVKLSYNTTFKRSFFKTLDINKYVCVKDTTVHTLSDSEHIDYNIPNKSEGYYVPITIINGEGEIEVTSYPINNSELEINNAEINGYYDVMYKYCCANKDEIGQNKLYIEANAENKIILQNAKAIKLGDRQANIINSIETEGKIELEIDDDASYFAYPNFFEVIK